MKLGFIGCGNMAQAMIKGILDKGLYSAQDIYAAEPFQETREKAEKQFGIQMTDNNMKVAVQADIIILAIKPIHFADAVPSIADAITMDKLVVSIGAGKTISEIENLLKKQGKVIRTMPNTPALVGAGAAGISCNQLVTDDDLSKVLDIFESFGTAQVVPERLMDAVVGVCGSAPAYVFMMIEAMADAAVADGIPRPQAYEFAAQTVLGSAKLMLESEKHPGELKDMVCSPGGTTQEAVCVLEEKGFRSAIIEAQRACVKKSKNM